MLIRYRHTPTRVKAAGKWTFFLLLQLFAGVAVAELSTHVKVGILARLHGLGGEMLGEIFQRYAACAALAVQHVNTRNALLVPSAQSLLPENFSLSVDLRDSRSSPSESSKQAIEWESEGVEVIIGTYRSAVAGPLSVVASIFNTPVIGWAATSTALSDKNGYPLFSRTVPPDSVLASGMVRILKELGWQRFAVLAINDAYGR